MKTQEEARATAIVLFNGNYLMNRGNGYYAYLEKLNDELLSRRGLEYAASRWLGVDLTLISRNDDERSFPYKVLGVDSRSAIRTSVLQLTADYEREQARRTAAKAEKLQDKYNPKS